MRARVLIMRLRARGAPLEATERRWPAQKPPHLPLTLAPTPAHTHAHPSSPAALMAWADKLWVVTYLSVPNAGSGAGLFTVDANMQLTRIATHNSTFANRMLHPPTQTAIIGPYVIDRAGNVRVIQDLLGVRIGGMALHLTYPETHVYMLGMDGPLWEVDLTTLQATQLFDLVAELDIPINQGEQPHFKAAHAIAGKLWVASNTFEQADFLDIQHGGRLAYWQGPGSNWTIVERTAFVEVTSRYNVRMGSGHGGGWGREVLKSDQCRFLLSLHSSRWQGMKPWNTRPPILTHPLHPTVTRRNARPSRSQMGCTLFAAGWDDASVILKVFDTGCGNDTSYETDVQTYRLPKASHTWDHLWTTEWPRIREIESERYLFDMHGMFYELAPFTWGGAAWGIKPIRQHLRMVPDFASWRGFLVLGGNQVSTIFE